MAGQALREQTFNRAARGGPRAPPGVPEQSVHVHLSASVHVPLRLTPLTQVNHKRETCYAVLGRKFPLPGDPGQAAAPR